MTAPKYKIGESVYHVLSQLDKGLVIDAQYSLRNSAWMYEVTFCKEQAALWYYSEELSNNPEF